MHGMALLQHQAPNIVACVESLSLAFSFIGIRAGNAASVVAPVTLLVWQHVILSRARLLLHLLLLLLLLLQQQQQGNIHPQPLLLNINWLKGPLLLMLFAVAVAWHVAARLAWMGCGVSGAGERSTMNVSLCSLETVI